MPDRGTWARLLAGPDSIPDVVKKTGNPALLNPNKTEGRRLDLLLRDIVETTKGVISRLTGNDIKGLDQKLENLSERDELPPGLLVAGMHVYVAYNATREQVASNQAAGIDTPPAEYVLQRDSSGPVMAFRDAKPTTIATVKTRWLRADGSLEEKAELFPELVLEDSPNIRKGDPRRWTVPPSTSPSFFLAKVDMIDMYMKPAPTGAKNDPNWIPFSVTPSVHNQNTDAGTTQASFVIQYQSQNQEQGEQRTLLGFGKAQGANPAMLAYKWQNNGNGPESTLEICHDWKGPEVYEADPTAPLNVWEPLRGADGGGVRVWDGNLQMATTGQVWVFAEDGIYRANSDFPFDENGGASGDWELLIRTGEIQQGWLTLPASQSDYTSIPNYITSRLLSYVLSTDSRLGFKRSAAGSYFTDSNVTGAAQLGVALGGGSSGAEIGGNLAVALGGNGIKALGVASFAVGGGFGQAWGQNSFAICNNNTIVKAANAGALVCGPSYQTAPTNTNTVGIGVQNYSLPALLTDCVLVPRLLIATTGGQLTFLAPNGTMHNLAVANGGVLTLNGSPVGAQGGGASQTEMQIISKSGQRVAVVKLTAPLQLLSALALAANNVQSYAFQVNRYSGGVWVAGSPHTTLAAAVAELQTVTAAERQEGAEMEITTVAANAANEATLIITVQHG